MSQNKEMGRDMWKVVDTHGLVRIRELTEERGRLQLVERVRCSMAGWREVTPQLQSLAVLQRPGSASQHLHDGSQSFIFHFEGI